MRSIIKQSERSQTALICQKNPREQRILADALQQHGIIVIEAKDVQEALALIEQYCPDIILLDVDFPVSIALSENRNEEISTGFQFCHLLSHRGVMENIPVMMLTASQAIDQVRLAYQNGACDFVSKPIDLPVLLERMNRILVTRRLNRKSEERLNYLTKFDPLTGLVNRANLLKQMKKSIVNVFKGSQTAAVLVIDIDNFKRINDILGHDFGDEVLQEISERLMKNYRSSDLLIHDASGIDSHTELARFGGDEFTIFIDNIESVSTAVAIAKRNIESITAPIWLNGEQIVVTSSVGIAIYPNDGEDVNNLLRNAEKAMYVAKASGGNTYRLYNEEMNASAKMQLRLETDLRNAIELNQLQLHYQPQIDSESGKIISLEALLRWYHPEFGLVGPDVFIPIAEASGLIIKIGDWVLSKACKQARCWLDQGFSLARIAVNVSAYQFHRSDFFAKTVKVLTDSNLPAHHLELELTESIIMSDAKENINKLKNFKDIGIGLAVDDFGTGYSSLSYLNCLPIDTLKIDRSFIANITEESKECAIVGAILALADKLGLKVIAEGVENLSQINFLKLNHCTSLQGFYYSRALPAHEVVKLIGFRKAVKHDSSQNKKIA